MRYYDAQQTERPCGRLYTLGYPNNPRQHDSKQIIKIQRSIESFGFINPILVDEKGQIIAGHARLKAAQLAHMEKFPLYAWVICPRGKSVPIVLQITN